MVDRDWFIPAFNLYKPFQIVKEAHKLLDPATPPRGTGLLVAWWVCGLAWDVLSIGLYRASVETLPQMRIFLAASVGLDALIVVTALLAAIVVRRIQAMAAERATIFLRVPSATVGREP